MNSIRIKFIRGEEVKYISHLDIMRVFERAARRGNLPIAYSQGFNPHPQMVFGLPLSVGVTSQAEYADLELTEELSPEKLMGRFNRELPGGLAIIDARIRTGKANIMASISAASYDVLLASELGRDQGRLQEKIDEFLSQPAIMVEKEGKRGKRNINIKPMVIKLELKKLQDAVPDVCSDNNAPDGNVRSDIWLGEYIKRIYRGDVLRPSFNREEIFCLSMLLSAGGAANLKPELLVAAFGKIAGTEDIKLVKIHRTGLFVDRDGSLLSPLDSRVL